MKEVTAWIPVFNESLASGNSALYLRLHYPTFLGAWLVHNYESWKPRNRIHGWAVRHFLRKAGVWLEYQRLRDIPSPRPQDPLGGKICRMIGRYDPKDLFLSDKEYIQKMKNKD